MKNDEQERNTRQKIYDFFEHPEGFWAYAMQFIIFFLIIGSVVLVVVESWYVDLFEQHKDQFILANHIVLGLFTVEYAMRLATAPQKLKWATKPMNIIDFLAVFPNYLEFVLHMIVNTTGLRGLRLIRLVRFLRFARLLRLLKLLKYGAVMKKTFSYEGTILKEIMPIIALFTLIKTAIWILESYGFWIHDPNLGELFAIIGFSLGIILSQKVASTYDKFLHVEETVVQLSGTLDSLVLILNSVEPEFGAKVCGTWAKEFLRILEDPSAHNDELLRANATLYTAMSRAEDKPAEIAMLHGQIVRDAAYVLSKKSRLTPKAYDLLLQQATMLYLAMIVIFIAGVTGVISVIIATYILYGMYYLTQDLDSIAGGNYNLISIDISEFKHLVLRI